MTRLEGGADATDRLNMIEANSFQIWLTAAQNDAAQSMINNHAGWSVVMSCSM